MQLQGIISGKHIELFHETNLPDGLLVTVDIQAKPLSLEEKQKLVDKLCGSWSEDNSLKQIFTEIENQRNSKLRECHPDNVTGYAQMKIR
ncbi:MAG: hypothetical protein GY749_06025 [Desulfobacteraceae bacterium]|nr:hypothetical protein [Desulfobacteraceae bacterium]